MQKPDHQDADLLLRLYELRREERMRQARHWVLHEYRPVPWEQMKATYMTGSPEDASLRMVTSYWDMVGTLVNNGILHAGLLFETTGEAIQVWNKVKGWVEGIRKETRPTYLRNLELLATRHLEWRQRHATSLPHEQARTPLRGVSGGDS
ncbi:MAG: hypothetical protein HYY53_03530 [candidate division NC10 bacterium]|nr:hypothetical protein [candidate division NC10 bacterium]